ncbi:MAG: hypothetical protein LUF28_05725 [Clostridiales bacterium]|nr:hypothetical protein [Clostridiales bacterium]
MNLHFNFFGLNDLNRAPKEDRPPRTGAARYFQVFWENLGKLLLGNLMCSLGFLPAALGVSLGLVYENFWLTLIGGAIGGAIAGPLWTAMMDLSLRCFASRVDEWFAAFRHTLRVCLKTAALQGMAVGVLVSGLLMVGSFASGLMEDGTLPAPVVWVMLVVDFFLVALAATLLFPPLCYQRQSLAQRVRDSLTLLARAPLRTLAAALGLLGWCALLGSLFPLSVPLSAVLGFWPPSLYVAQLLRPGLLEQFGQQEEPPEREAPEGEPDRYTMGQRSEIWWRRHRGAVLAVVAVICLALGVIQTVTSFREPDVQVAFVHADSLPDNVLTALETSLGELVGNLNGDGEIVVQVNDYQVVFDGTPPTPTYRPPVPPCWSPTSPAGRAACSSWRTPRASWRCTPTRWTPPAPQPGRTPPSSPRWMRAPTPRWRILTPTSPARNCWRSTPSSLPLVQTAMCSPCCWENKAVKCFTFSEKNSPQTALRVPGRDAGKDGLGTSFCLTVSFSGPLRRTASRRIPPDAARARSGDCVLL